MHDQIVLLAETKSNAIEVITFKALINPNISHDTFFLNFNKRFVERM